MTNSQIEAPESLVRALRNELVGLRGHRGISIAKIEEGAPILMSLPCVDAEIASRGLTDADRAHAALSVIECLARSALLHANVQEVMTFTLNLDMADSTLEERRLDAQTALGSLNYRKHYLQVEEDFYLGFAHKLAACRITPCQSPPDPDDLDREKIKLSLRQLVLDYGRGDDARGFRLIRSAFEELAPTGASLLLGPLYEPDEDGLTRLLRVIARTTYASTLLRESPTGYVPARMLELLPFLRAYLLDVPVVTDRTAMEFWGLSASQVRQELGEPGTDIDAVLVRSVDLFIAGTEAIEDVTGWELAIESANPDLGAFDWDAPLAYDELPPLNPGQHGISDVS